MDYTIKSNIINLIFYEVKILSIHKINFDGNTNKKTRPS